MATTSKSFSGEWGDGPTVYYDGTIKITREKKTDKKVTVSVSITFELNRDGKFGENADGKITGYDLEVLGDSKGVNDTFGWRAKQLVGSGKRWKYPNTRTATWLREFSVTGDQLTWKMCAIDSTDGTHNFKTKTSPLEIVCKVPEYSSGSSSGGGTTPTISPNKLTISATPTSITEGNSSTITVTATRGANNSIEMIYLLSEDSDNPIKSEAFTSSPHTMTAYVYPSKTTEYTAIATSELSPQKTAEVTVTVKPPIPTITSASIFPTKVDNRRGGQVELSVQTNTKTKNGNLNSFSYYINGIFQGYDYTSRKFSVNSGDRITVKAYDGIRKKESTGSKVLTVGGYTPVEINSFSVTAKKLKDNLSEPDLANIIERASISVSNANSIEWYYRESSSPSSVHYASRKSLGVSGSSFSNLDMSQKVSKGNYYTICAYVSNADTALYSDNSEVFQIPATPSPATITEVIPKANPSEGYNEISQDGKIFYGSGLFLLWKNPVIQSSQLPIANIEIIYQSRRQGASIFEETKFSSIQYYKLFRNGESTTYGEDINNDGRPDRPFLTSGASNGGGADLEVNSLYETRIGIRVTDTLGEYRDVWYTPKYYYKAESPEFGGNLVVNWDTFRPFTCIENDRLIFSSSVARSNSQDELLYTIEIYVGDRKIPIDFIKNIPISTKAFSDGNINPNDIVYPVGASGNEDIIVKKENATTIRYEVKNKYLKDILLSNIDLRTPRGNLNPVYNEDFVEVVYKASVRDDFDSRSTVYNSVPTSIRYIEAPSLKHNPNIEIGINRYLLSENPFYDNSIVLLNSLSENNDRIINPGESIVFKFKRAKDYNGADYLTTMIGDVSQYNVYVSRSDEVVSDINNYDKLNYILLKSFNANLSSDGGDLKKAYPNNSNDEYYYLEYPLVTYQESKFVTFKIEAVDSRGKKSEVVYSNTYLVPCRANEMNFHINNVSFYKENNFNPTFSIKLNDLGASKFISSKYTYKNYPNFERKYSVGIDANKNNFTKKAYLLFEGSIDGTFEQGSITLTKDEEKKILTKIVNKYMSLEIDIAALSGNELYSDYIGKLPYSITNFPQEWKEALDDGFIKKIFFKATYKIAYGFKDLSKKDFEEKYLVISSVSAPYSFYEDAPTVSYRNHQVGINTKDFGTDSNEGQKEVLIIQDNGSYNLVVFKGAEQKIELNLTERTFTATTENNDKVVINFNSGLIEGMTIDGGSW